MNFKDIMTDQTSTALSLTGKYTTGSGVGMTILGILADSTFYGVVSVCLLLVGGACSLLYKKREDDRKKEEADLRKKLMLEEHRAKMKQYDTVE